MSVDRTPGGAGSGLSGRRVRGDGGNAIVEFVYLAVLLMVPLVYVLLAVFRVQAASYAVASAAREAGRVFATSADVTGASERAFTAASIVMRDSGLDLSQDDVAITCSTRRCLVPGGRVHVVVNKDVPLPWLPDLFAGRSPASVQVSSRHLQVVDRYREPGR